MFKKTFAAKHTLDCDSNYDSWLFSYPVTIGILGSTSEAQAQFKLVPKFVKKKTPLELFLVRKVSLFKSDT